MTFPGDLTVDDFARLFEDLRARSGVVGASLAISLDDDVWEFSSGVTEVGGGNPVVSDTRFLVGSTTKSFTATLIGQLVDEGRIGLDDPVGLHVPDLPASVGSIAVRHLLSHTSGIENGPYADHGPDDDAVAAYVASLDGVHVAHEPGARFGYSNAAYVVAGRLVEVLTGSPWRDAVRERLLEPAGLNDAFTLTEDGVAGAVAPGHRLDASGSPTPAPALSVAGPAMGPTGSTLCCTARDLVAFGTIFVREGVAPNGVKMISPATTAAMLETQTTLPAGSTIAYGWTPGFLVEDYDGVDVYGHTGHNMGAGSYLRFLPDEHFAMALLFNSPGDATLFHELTKVLVDDFFGIRKPDPWILCEAGLDLDLEPYTGRFRIMGEVREVVAGDGGLRIVDAPDIASRTGLGQVMRPATRTVFGTTTRGQYTVEPPAGALAPDLIFDGFVDGRPQFAYGSVFLFPRVS